MQNNFLLIGAALVLVVLLSALTDPFMLAMSAPVAMLCLVAAAAAAAVFAGFVLSERGGDEREEAHRAFSGRAGYLAGLALLTLGVLWEGFTLHHVDPWLLSALAGMVLAKVVARMWIDSHQ